MRRIWLVFLALLLALSGCGSAPAGDGRTLLRPRARDGLPLALHPRLLRGCGRGLGISQLCLRAGFHIGDRGPGQLLPPRRGRAAPLAAVGIRGRGRGGAGPCAGLCGRHGARRLSAFNRARRGAGPCARLSARRPAPGCGHRSAGRRPPRRRCPSQGP